jgi:hypothetical protein
MDLKKNVLFSIFLNIDETYVLKLTDLIKGPKTSQFPCLEGSTSTQKWDEVSPSITTHPLKNCAPNRVKGPVTSYSLSGFSPRKNSIFIKNMGELQNQ